MAKYLIKDTMAVYVTWLYVFETTKDDVLEDFMDNQHKDTHVECLGHEFGDPVEDGFFGDLKYEEITEIPNEVKRAKLDAAAPDLLTALKAAESCIETPGDLTDAEIGHVLEDARAAIVKAT